MKRLLAIVFVAAGLSGLVSAQVPPAFEAADIKLRPRSPNPNPVMTGGVLRSGRYDLRYATMLDLITTAYTLPSESVLGWAELARMGSVRHCRQGGGRHSASRVANDAAGAAR